MSVAPKRKSERAFVSIVARYRSPLIFDYVNERCYDLSYGGMFIKSGNPVNPGTLLKLECLIDEGPDKIHGVARVVWVRRVDRPEGPRGMGVKFVKLEPGSEELIEKIMEKSVLSQQEAQEFQAQPSHDPDDANREYREANQPLQESLKEAEDSFEEGSAEQTSIRTDEETHEPPEPFEEEPLRDYAGSEPLQDPSIIEQNAAVTPSSTPEQKATIFPKWAMAVCVIALGGLVYLSFYDDDARVKSADQKIQEQANEERSTSSSKQEGKSAQRVSITKQISESKPGVKEDDTRSNPARTENQPAQSDLEYVLRITTSPSGARVFVNHRSIISPGTLKLGAVSSPIRVTATKKDFHSTRVIVDPSIFVPNANALEGQVHLVLKPKPSSSKTLQPNPPQEMQLGQSDTHDRKSPTQIDQTDSFGDEDQPMKANELKPQPDSYRTLFKTATRCIAKGDNACVIKTLKDKASTEEELGLLVETYRAVGDTSNASKYMKRFIEKYPKSNRSKIYRKIVETDP